VHVLVLPPVLFGLTALHLYLMRRHGVSGPIRSREGVSESFFPHQAARDLTVAILAGILLAVLAWKGAPALEAPADPTATDYTPRPDWYFLGLFQLLKYFPGRLEVVGAIVIPGAVMTLLALLPWIDRARTRGLRDRRWLLSGLAVLVAAVTTLTVMGAMDTPPAASAEWNVREQAGLALISSTTCTSCHSDQGRAGAIDLVRVSRPRDWVAGHLLDPQMIAPGLRDAPATNEHDNNAILAALARGRSGSAPVLSSEEAVPIVLFNRNCLRCHVMGSVGGNEGPKLSDVGVRISEPNIVKQITAPKSVKPTGEMPAFEGKLSPDEITTLARWLSGHK
jgi:ubiquinol-cytochrome c reductase cytochrome b subunit